MVAAVFAPFIAQNRIKVMNRMKIIKRALEIVMAITFDFDRCIAVYMM